MAATDGLTLHKQVNELSRLLTGGKVDKINMPENDEVHITVRSQGENYRLLICAAPDKCRVQITQNKKPNPTDAPMFCMLMRKHLSGGRIKSISQPNNDRIVRIDIENVDELYNTTGYSIICELMGRHSNVFLTNADGIILGCMKNIGSLLTSERVTAIGATYTDPPTEKKQNPYEASFECIEKVLCGQGRVDKLLSNAFYGIAPVVVPYFTEYATSYSDTLTDGIRRSIAESFLWALKETDESERMYVAQAGEKDVFVPFMPRFGEYREYPSPSAMYDAYYAERDKKDFMHRRSASLLHTVETKLAREEKKLAAIILAINSEADYDKYRVYGELVTANLHRISQGQNSVIVENYYEYPPVTVEIPLDVMLSPIKNAQKYFKKYKKAKGARDTALLMHDEVTAHIEYLTSVQDCIKRADSVETLEAIYSELEAQKIVRRDKKKQKKEAKKPSFKYISTDGFEIAVGRNNVQNDELTFRTAKPNDLWLHVKDRPGSHTVVFNPERETIPDSTVYEAACIAAYHSSAGDGGAKVEVDATLCRFVKKPAGALPGKVIYTNQKTYLVIPKLPEVKE